MPLLGDSKSVYVGTTPITKVMAGDVEVWPKVPVIPGCYPPASAIGFYSFEDNLKNSEGSAPDLEDNSYDPLSTLEYVDGPFGKCVKRGYSTNVASDIQLEAEITPTTRPFTVEAWFKIDDLIFKVFESVEMEFSSGDFQDINANKLQMQIYNGTNSPLEGRILCRIGHGTGFNGDVISTIASTLGECGIVSDNQWFHFALSCDMDGTNGKAWINGKFFRANDNTPFVPGQPLTKLGVRIIDQDHESHMCVDELRLSKEIVYPDSDITPCS